MTTTATAHFDKIRVYLFGLNKQTINNLTEHLVVVAARWMLDCPAPRLIFFLILFIFVLLRSVRMSEVRAVELLFTIQWKVILIYKSCIRVEPECQDIVEQTDTSGADSRKKRRRKKNFNAKLRWKNFHRTSGDDDDRRRRHKAKHFANINSSRSVYTAKNHKIRN